MQYFRKWCLALFLCLFFALAPSAKASVAVGIEERQILANQEFKITAEAQEASSMEMIVEDPEGGVIRQWTQDGNRNDFYLSLEWEGEYTFHVTAYDADGNVVDESESCSVTVEAPDGTSEEATFLDVPALIRIGEDLEVRGSASGAGNVIADIHKIDENGWHYIENMNVSLAEDGSFTARFSGIEEVGLYAVSLRVREEGKNGSDVYREVAVAESTADIGTVQGWVFAENAITNKNFFSMVYAEGAKWVGMRIEKKDDPDWNDGWNDAWKEFCVSGEAWQTNQTGTYRFVPFGYYEEDEDGNGFFLEGDPLQVEVTAPNGDLDSPLVTMGDKFYLGDKITIHYEEIENAERYSYWVHTADNGDYITGDERYDAGDLFLSTDNLVGPNVYHVELDVNAEGYAEGHWTLHFALLDPEEQESEPEGFLDGAYYSQSAEYVLTGEEFYLVAYLPAAGDGICLYVCADGEDLEDGFQIERGGPGLRFDKTWDHAGLYRFYVSGCYGGEWSEPMYVGEVEVTAPHGDLEEPNIHIPPVLRLGEDLQGYFEGADGASYVNVDLNYYIDEEGDWEYLSDITLEPGEKSFSFAAEYFAKPGTYRVGIYASGEGYNATGIGNRFVVSDREAEEISLTINGEKGEAEVLINEDFSVDVVAPGAKAIRIYRDWWDYYFPNDSRNGYADVFSYGDPGLYSIVAQATYDSFDAEAEDFDWNSLSWTATSNGIRVRVKSLGYIDQGGFVLPDTVARGDMMRFDLIGADNADYYEVYIDELDENGEYIGCSFGMTVEEPGVYMIPTSNMEPGTWYLHMKSAAAGYHESWTDYQAFTVTEPTEQFSFQIGSLQVQTWEDFQVSVYASGADAVKVCLGDEEDCWAFDWSETISTPFMVKEPGDYWFRAYASYDEGDTWEEAPISYTVTAESSLGKLDDPVILCPNTVAPGENLEFSIPVVPHVEFYAVHICSRNEWGDWDPFYDVCIWTKGKNEVVYHVDAADLESNKAYLIQVWTNPSEKGYEWSYSEKQIFVTDSQAPVQLSIDQTEFMTGYEVPFTIYAPEAQWNEEDANYLLLVNNGETERFEYWGGNMVTETMHIWDAGSFEVKAQVYINGDWVESEPVTVSVSALGQLEAPACSFPSYVMWGQDDFTFSFEDAGDVGWYKLMIDGEYAGAIANCDFEEPGTYTLEDVRFLDDGLEPGKIYRMSISVWSLGYLPGWSGEYMVAIVDPEKVLTLPAEVTEIGEESFADTGAQMIILPEGITDIGEAAFMDNRDLIALRIPEGVSYPEDITTDCFHHVVIVR